MLVENIRGKRNYWVDKRQTIYKEYLIYISIWYLV